MRPVKLFAVISASLIAVSAAAITASAENEPAIESSTALNEPAVDNTDSISEEGEDKTLEPSAVNAAVAAALEPTASLDETEKASAGAQAGIVLALAAVACSIVVVSRRQ